MTSADVLVLALLLLAFAVAEGGILVVRGIGAPDVPVAQRNDVTVLSWNTLGDSVPAQVIAEVAAQNHATVLTLPETTADRARQVAGLLAAGGSRYTVLSVSQQAGIPREEAQARLEQFQTTYQQYTQQAAEQAREAADVAANTVAQMSFWSVVALILGGILAAVGGNMGTPRDLRLMP